MVTFVQFTRRPGVLNSPHTNLSVVVTLDTTPPRRSNIHVFCSDIRYFGAHSLPLEDLMHKVTTVAVALAALALMACESKDTTTAPEANATAQPVANAETTQEKPASTTVENKEEPAAPTSTGFKNAATILGLGKTPADIEPGAKNLYGGNFSISEEPIPLSDALTKAADSEGPYKISAKVKKVCQKKGCWMTLHDENTKLPIRVKMKDYAFFVPMNANDLPTIAEGTLKKVTVPQDVAQHYADDEAEATGKPAEKIDGPQESFEFTASAVQIENPKG